ncbi:multidrug effflux MFS transporter [Janthinobacterium fluminis]|uniref:Bcr/CflA family efflux transporter n=1 Tax=Janthinobacterium fluminis TaxID=2987524 RepID=A0ABT5K8R5_9BURK|nr:multidrug effflux MFS transporter [Janthinobacterium fluminis]MDC8760870.1 multidrug effflux MFS transporter [Janthinobacterium fluminis]
MHDKPEPAPWAWTAILLLVVCLPRISIDIYLPSLPAMADALRAPYAQMQLTLTMYMAGSALSMLLCGPLADRYGRRPVLLAGGALYLLASAVCAGATSAPVIIAARLFQALGGCSGTLIGRVMVRDRFDQASQAGMLSRISMGMALSPIVAPLIGSVIDAALGWRWVFLTLTALATLMLALVAGLLPETRPAPAAARPPATARIYLRLLGDPYFLRYALAIGCVYCTYFPFIAESSLLLQRSLHLSASAYALVFGLTVSGYLAGSNLFRRLGPRLGADRMIALAVAVNGAGAALLWAATTLYPTALAALVGPMLLIMLSVGVAIPACQFAVLQPYAAIAGTASGLFFFIQMAITTLCGGAVVQLSDGSARPIAWVTAAASAAFCTAWLALRGGQAKLAGSRC